MLVVAPTSVVNNWEHELRKFAPTLGVFVHHGEKRLKGQAFAQEVKNKSVVITSYPLIYRDLSSLEAVQWQGLVLDEAQNIKNFFSVVLPFPLKNTAIKNPCIIYVPLSVLLFYGD